MIRVLRYFLIMAVVFVCMVWLLGCLGWVAGRLIPQAHSTVFDQTTFCAVARSIFEEAGRDERTAEKLARERGFTSRQIWAAKKFCK